MNDWTAELAIIASIKIQSKLANQLYLHSLKQYDTFIFVMLSRGNIKEHATNATTVDSNGSYKLHGTGTGNGTRMGTIGNNGSLSLSLSLCSVYST